MIINRPLENPLKVNPLSFIFCQRPGIVVLVWAIWLQVTEIKIELV